MTQQNIAHQLVWNDSYLPRVKVREPEYMNSLYEDANPYLRKMLWAQKIVEPTAQDLIHDVWKIFFNKIENFEGRSQLRTFLGGILINCIREYRRQQKRLQFEADADSCFESALNLEGWWQQAPKDPENIMQEKQLLELIEDGLEKLTPKQRQAFVMREIQDLETEEICKKLGVSVSHLGVLIYRGRETLMEHLKLEAGL